MRIPSSRPAWAIVRPCLKNKTQNKRQLVKMHTRFPFSFDA
jgi:hypothetical protein